MQPSVTKVSLYKSINLNLQWYWVYYNNLRVKAVEQLTEEERKRILESPPMGTFALMSVVLGGMVIAWLFLYYGVFLPRG